MRTTLTLDDDVASRLEGLRRSHDRSYRDIVNEALRLGLDRLASPSLEPQRPYRTNGVSLGGSLVGDVANVHEVLAIVEGDRRR